MIVGIGIDLVNIKKIEKLMKNERFADRILTKNEKLDYDKAPIKQQYLAGRFAAKEAVVKALGVGISKCAPNLIETYYDENGAPYVRLYGNALTVMRSIGVYKLHISITHDNNMASAFAVAEKL